MVSFDTPVVLALALSFLTKSLALPLEESLGSDLVARSGKFFRLDFTRRSPVAEDVHSRGLSPVNEDLDEDLSTRSPKANPLSNHNTWYAVDLLVGSNKDRVTLQIDTGSNILWVVNRNATCVPSKGYEPDYCTMYGAFDSSKSSSYKSENKHFGASYLGGTSDFGTWATDDFTLPGGPTVKGLRFGNVNSTSKTKGMLGLSHTDTNRSFTQLMREQGQISKAAYSIFLNDKDASAGSIIFGGIDTAKYEGELVTIKQNTSNIRAQLETIQVGNNSVQIDDPIVFDTGNAGISVSPDVYDKYVKVFQGKLHDDTKDYVIPCEQPDDYITFKFEQNVNIKVPYSIFVGSEVTKGKCEIKLHKGGSGRTQNFGDPFIRNTYLVFNIEDKELLIAQAKYTSKSHIIPIE